MVTLPALRALAGPRRKLHLIGNASVAKALAPQLFASITSIDDPVCAGLFDAAGQLRAPTGGAIVLLRRHVDVSARLAAAGWSPILGFDPVPHAGSHAHIAAHLFCAVEPAVNRVGHTDHTDHTLLSDTQVLAVTPARRSRPYVVIHPGSGSRRKNWPLERFTAVANRIDRAGLEPLVLTGPSEPHLALDGRSILRDWPLDDVAQLLAGAALYVGNDSGISHVAGAVGAPTVAVFGPTRAERWHPLGPRVATVEPLHRCSLCAAADDLPADCNCLETITVEAVVASATELTGIRL